MENKSGIKPVGPRVLVKPDEAPKTYGGSLFEMPPEEHKREQLGMTKGVVVAKGDECNDWCKVGDRIVFGRYAGQLDKGKDGIEYRMIRDVDQTALLEDGSDE